MLMFSNNESFYNMGWIQNLIHDSQRYAVIVGKSLVILDFGKTQKSTVFFNMHSFILLSFLYYISSQTKNLIGIEARKCE